MIYKASWDTFTKIMTIGIAVLFTGLTAYPFLGDHGGRQVPYLTGIILALTYGICYAFRPICYELSGHQVIIHRPLKNVVINRSDIAGVRIIRGEQLRGTIRTFGVGGLFGYFGKFYNSKLGKMTWYATRRGDAILITTTLDKKILITPDEVSGFARQFGKRNVTP